MRRTPHPLCLSLPHFRFLLNLSLFPPLFHPSPLFNYSYSILHLITPPKFSIPSPFFFSIPYFFDFSSPTHTHVYTNNIIGTKIQIHNNHIETEEMRSMASSTSSRGIAAIVGVGPNLGLSIARKFAHEGYTVAILARDLGRLSRFADEIAREEKAQVFAIRIDCSDSRSVREAFEGVLSLGFVEVLVYNANYQQNPNSNWKPTSFQHLRIESFEKSLAVSSVGAFHCAQQVLPGMVERGKGTILFTGCSASLNGIAGYSELCCGKFALRALSQCLAREFQPQGVHVAHIIIDGLVGPPRGAGNSSQRVSFGEVSNSGVVVGGGTDGTLDPDTLAQTYWQLHVQDRNAWTQEMDLRSSNARFF